jgi:hypothetical protein
MFSLIAGNCKSLRVHTQAILIEYEKNYQQMSILFKHDC